MINDNSNINSISDGADFWYYQIGVIITTVNTQEKNNLPKPQYH